MKATLGLLIAAPLLLGSVHSTVAAEATDLKDKVKLQVLSVGLHPGMDPGLYICAAGHLHIRATVENLADVPLGNVKVAGTAYDADGTLLGTATSSTKAARLAPNEQAEVNLEFLTVTGPKIQQVTRHEETVVEAPVGQ